MAFQLQAASPSQIMLPLLSQVKTLRVNTSHKRVGTPPCHAHLNHLPADLLFRPCVLSREKVGTQAVGVTASGVYRRRQSMPVTKWPPLCITRTRWMA